MKKKIIIGAILAILAIPIAVLAVNLNTFCDGRTDGNYAHPLDDTMFIQCNNGMAQEMSCPAGLIYDEAMGYCIFGESGRQKVCYETITTHKSSRVIFCGSCDYVEGSKHTEDSKVDICPK